MDTKRKLATFVDQMSLVIDLHDKKKGDSWKTCDISFLFQKLDEERKEVDDATKAIKRAKELIDEAVMCMFLYHRCMDIWVKDVGKIFDKRK